MTKKTNLPRNTIHLDGLPWIKRAGQAWGNYDVCAEYVGIARSSFPVYVWRHGLKTITHGRYKLVRKRDLDQVSGAISGEQLSTSEQMPLRARR